MTPRQKDIISALALANAIVIVAWIVLVTRPSYPDPMSVSPAPTPTLAYWKCQWQATQLLAQAGLGGTVTPTSDGLLHFEISSPIAHPDSDPPDRNLDAVGEAAQAVWTVFDVALALQERADQNPADQNRADQNPEDVCPLFTRIQVTILAARPGAQAAADAADPLIRRDQLIPSDMRISASVSAADLAAFGAGELSEDEFIDRVTYTISENDN
jgi:hypothetical protein